MDPNTAELTTVIEHDASGRIKKFIKHYVPLDCVPGLKAVAQLRDEENKAGELAKSADRLIEKLHEPRENATHAALLEKARQPSASPAPQLTPQQPQLSAPAQPVARPAVRSHHERSSELRELALLARDVVALRREEMAQEKAQKKRLDNARLLVREVIHGGRDLGRKAMLKVISQTPPGYRASNVDVAMDQCKDQTFKPLLRKLEAAGCPPTWLPELADAFSQGWWIGANQAFVDFNNGQEAMEAAN
jgi:hypothetical protein